ncbi:MAG: septal ring lytic transglycosylase RlpA family protein [Gammaproteobacteria bacterium]|nr:septal ring lytic transglycosylase RlpA family protein [Gammaproteobacteria bacterium]
MYFIFLILSILYITGCQHTKPPMNTAATQASVMQAPKLQLTQSHADGAPPGPKPTLFQKVTPINEPLSHYGNPGSYRVKGKLYDVLTSSKGYQKQGTASWYGTRFHKERTSSGEEYDMYALTAAHKTLPLPTYVRVKNLENGRETIVKVNDRGPFHKDRIIDLSYAAAAKIGLLPKGTARVEIEALTSAPKAEYYLQVGAFQSSEKAGVLRDKLIALKFKADVKINERDARYVIHLGPFSDKQHAELSQKRLKQQGISESFTYLE